MPKRIFHVISPAQCRMARAALNWPTKHLAERADIGHATITRFERGQQTITPPMIDKISRAFEKEKIDFINDGLAVSMRKPKRVTKS